jgi:hypothetical protein
MVKIIVHQYVGKLMVKITHDHLWILEGCHLKHNVNVVLYSVQEDSPKFYPLANHKEQTNYCMIKRWTWHVIAVRRVGLTICFPSSMQIPFIKQSLDQSIVKCKVVKPQSGYWFRQNPRATASEPQLWQAASNSSMTEPSAPMHILLIGAPNP